MLLRHLPHIVACCPRVEVPDDGAIHREGEQADDFLLVLKGTCRSDAVPWPKGNGARGPPARAPVLIGASAFLTRSARQETLRVSLDDEEDDEEDEDGGTAVAGGEIRPANPKATAESSSSTRDCVVYSIGARELAALKERSPEAFIATVLAASCSLSPLLRRFISLGLNRVWLSAGEAAYLQGEEATSMYVLISGRIRLLQNKEKNRLVGAANDVPRTTTTTTTTTRRSRPGFGRGGFTHEERGRGETIGEAPLLAGGRYPSTAMCLRDSELVRMSRGALTLVCARNPVAASRLLEAMARKLHATLKGAGAKPDMVTICLVPATGAADARATATLARDLRRALRGFGPTLWLDETAARGVFNDDTVGKLQSKFYGSKMTGWMAQQEENYRFILLQADASASPWSQVCVSQADKILVVARASNPDPDPHAHERRLLWRRRPGAATELVLVHDPGEAPRNLRRFRATRPDVGRHHPLRLEAEEDLQRLARHIAGHAVGVVLTGGGGHGLAHLGALRALEDSGVPVDCVGGTSQGALMAALYARHASTTHMLPRVKELVGALSSPRHLLTDLTLPVLSIFSGKGVDRILRTVLGDTDIEDLWLSFFCVSTNLTSGGLSTHTSGTVWRYVRASMTILGMLPPVRDDQTGDLLVDGGYLNAIPVDVLRERMGVETVVVVDVEDNDYTAFRNLTPHDGGLGGWRLLWERINPFGSWLGRWFLGPSIDEASPASGGGGGGGGNRTGERAVAAVTAPAPSYASLLNALTTAASSRHLAQARKEHAVNLYLRPPGVSGWVAPLTPARVDALVRRAHRYACGAIADWQRAASAERVRDAKAARAEARDLAESRGAFHLGSPVRGSSAGDTGHATPSAAHGDVDLEGGGGDDLLAAARGGGRGERGKGRNRTTRDWVRSATAPDDSGRLRKRSRCTSGPAGAPRDRRGRRRGARRPDGSARRSRPSPPGTRACPRGSRGWTGPRREETTALRRDAPSPAAATTPQGPRTSRASARPSRPSTTTTTQRPSPERRRRPLRRPLRRRPTTRAGEKSVVVETGSRTGRVGVGARRASGRDRERHDRPAGADDDEPAASQERAGADAPAVAPLLHDAPEGRRRRRRRRRRRARLSGARSTSRSLPIAWASHPRRTRGRDRDAAKGPARSAGDDAAGGQASARGRDSLGRVAQSRYIAGRGRVRLVPG